MIVGPINSFVADGTTWFEYVPDQIGNWTVQFTYPGDYYPAGRYVNGVLNNSAPPGSSFMDQRDYPETWYKPPQTPVQTLTVQEEPVMSWYSPLPTDYWTRPISPENREWSAIGGNFPYAYYNSYPTLRWSLRHSPKHSTHRMAATTSLVRHNRR